MSKVVIVGNAKYLRRHFQTLESDPDLDIIYTEQEVADVLGEDPDIVVVHDEHWCKLGHIVAECNARGIPTIQMMDGILEWRRTWDYQWEGHIIDGVINPLNQPAFADKVACLGSKDYRILESWGNFGKCEIVGMPRVRHLMNLRKDFSHLAQKKNRIMVSTSKTPAFTEAQAEKTIRSLKDLKDYFSKRDDIEVIWRLTGNYSELVGVKNELNDLSGKEIHEAIQQVDAIITTPSTTILEAMLLKTPVAILEYQNQPHYFDTAWSITAKPHIDEIVNELITPPAAKLEYQDFLFNEQLYIHEDPNQRLIRLIKEMVKYKGNKKEIPASILDNSYLGTLALKSDLSTYYPGLEWVDKMDVKKLKLELSAARGTIEVLEKSNQILKNRLHSVPFYKVLKSLKERFK